MYGARERIRRIRVEFRFKPFAPDMPHLLTLRGRHALSPFRVAKLHAALAASRPGHAVSSVSAEYWHFVEIERALDAIGARDARSRS